MFSEKILFHYLDVLGQAVISCYLFQQLPSQAAAILFRAAGGGLAANINQPRNEFWRVNGEEFEKVWLYSTCWIWWNVYKEVSMTVRECCMMKGVCCIVRTAGGTTQQQLSSDNPSPSVSAAVSSDQWAPADNIKTLFSDNSPHQLQDQWIKNEDECSWFRQDSSSVTSKLTKKRITKQSVRLRIFPWKGYIKHYSEPQDQSWRNLGWEHRPYSCN